MHKYLAILVFSIFLNASEIKIASYNVENFFDLTYDKTEYEEFIPDSTSLWNKKNFNIKLNNIIKVISDLDADIIALQEIENIELMKILRQKLPQYQYYSFIKYPNSAVGLGFLSKIKIKNSASIDVKFSNAIYRPILEVTFVKEEVEFKIFNNHWPSKRASEIYRIKYAKALFDRLKSLKEDYDYILLGDFNSDYNEFETFKKNLKLNQSAGVTGINHILNTIINEKFITKDDIKNYDKKVHYNLWLDLKAFERFSTKFKNQNNTPDNIILPSSLFDNKGLSYKDKSFFVFKEKYLYDNEKIFRWQMNETNKKKKHKGEGFSDHLPIYATFYIKNKNSSEENYKTDTKIVKISKLYDKEKLLLPAFLDDSVLIYKNEDSAIIKQKNDRAIYIFKGAKYLKLGYCYTLQINEIYDFYGLKEIKEFSTLKEKEEEKDYKKLFLDASKINIFDFKYENEIITNLKGRFSKNKLILADNKSIKIFSKDKNILPKDGENIYINEAHLASYRGNMQIIFHKKSDYKVLK